MSDTDRMTKERKKSKHNPRKGERETRERRNKTETGNGSENVARMEEGGGGERHRIRAGLNGRLDQDEAS